MAITKLNMNLIQFLNVFEKVTKVRTRLCFTYGPTIIFLVDKDKISQAIGKEGINVKKINKKINKKIKIVLVPESINDFKSFIEAVIFPVKIKKIVLDEKNTRITIMAGPQAKAALIGRDKVRFNELKEIIKRQLGIKKLRII